MMEKQIAIILVMNGIGAAFFLLMHVTARARRHRRNYRERMRLTRLQEEHEARYGGHHPSDTAELVDKLIELESENQCLRGYIEKMSNENKA